MAGFSSRKTIIYWIRNDLRLHDNECLNFACRDGSHVLPLYCFDPDHYKLTHHFGFLKTGIHRAKLILDAVSGLRNSLQKKGSNLVISKHRPKEAIEKLILECEQTAPVTSIVFQKEITKEETDVEASVFKVCDSKGIQVLSFWGSTLYHIEDIPFQINQIPNTYTLFRKGVEKCPVRKLNPIPDKISSLPNLKNFPLGEVPLLNELGFDKNEYEIDVRSVFPFNGSEVDAVKRLNEYLWGNSAILTYKETRNGLLGKDYSTKFSPWLALGSLSPRMIYHKIKDFEEQKKIKENDSTYWVVFELIWRDYFKFICSKHGNKVFFKGGLKGGKGPWTWKQDLNLFMKWANGDTGIPFVDANMKELLATGWMSNRGRQNVASFLVKDLNLDWRMGAEWFESLLIDSDVCSNYGNWNYIAGIGNDPRSNRKFNVIKQAADYDEEGDYVRTWLPVLKKLGICHTPWRLSASELNAGGVDLGKNYPHPIIVAPEWAKHALKMNSKNCFHEHRGKQNGQKRSIDFYFKSGKTGE
uniref:Cryptochrome DASH n=1 Tax=Hydra vulgaris TaxID=6087 RepID=T2MCV5_HYDVU